MFLELVNLQDIYFLDKEAYIVADVFETFVPIDWEKLSVPEAFGKEMNRICKAILDNNNAVYNVEHDILSDLSVSLAAYVSDIDTNRHIPHIQKGTFTPKIDWGGGNKYSSTGEGTYIRIGPLQFSRFHVTVNDGDIPSISGFSGVVKLMGLPTSSNVIPGQIATHLNGVAFMTTDLTAVTGYAYHILQNPGTSYAYLVARPADEYTSMMGYVRPIDTATDPLGNITSVIGYTITYN